VSARQIGNPYDKDLIATIFKHALAAAFFAVGVYLTVENVSNAWENFLGNKTRILYKPHDKNKSRRTHDKHTARRSGKTYGQNRNNKRGEKNKKYMHPENRNILKR